MRKEIQQEQEDVFRFALSCNIFFYSLPGRSAKPVNIFFLTLESPRQVFTTHSYSPQECLCQAFTVQLLEENLGSTYGNISIAPAPRDIVWQNMKSSIYLWSYYFSFVVLFIIISCLALTPLVFATQVRNFLYSHLKIFDPDSMPERHREIFEIVMTLTNSVLFFTFSLLTPYFVKVLILRGSVLPSSHPHLPANDRPIWDVEQGKHDLPVCHCLLHLGLWHHHPLPILPGALHSAK